MDAHIDITSGHSILEKKRVQNMASLLHRLQRFLMLITIVPVLAGCFHTQLGGSVGGATITIAPLDNPSQILTSGTSWDDQFWIDRYSQAEWDEWGPVFQQYLLGVAILNTDMLDDDTLYLVTASGGQDTDANYDDSTDGQYTDVRGEWHLIVTGKRAKKGNLRISALTEAAYQAVKDEIAGGSDRQITATLDAIAQDLLGDLDEDGTVTYEDLLKWSRLGTKLGNPSTGVSALNELSAAVTNNATDSEIAAAAGTITRREVDSPPFSVSGETGMYLAEPRQENGLYAAGYLSTFFVGDTGYGASTHVDDNVSTGYRTRHLTFTSPAADQETGHPTTVYIQWRYRPGERELYSYLIRLFGSFSRTDYQLNFFIAEGERAKYTYSNSIGDIFDAGEPLLSSSDFDNSNPFSGGEAVAKRQFSERAPASHFASWDEFWEEQEDFFSRLPIDSGACPVWAPQRACDAFARVDQMIDEFKDSQLDDLIEDAPAPDEIPYSIKCANNWSSRCSPPAAFLEDGQVYVDQIVEAATELQEKGYENASIILPRNIGDEVNVEAEDEYGNEIELTGSQGNSGDGGSGSGQSDSGNPSPSGLDCRWTYYESVDEVEQNCTYPDGSYYSTLTYDLDSNDDVWQIQLFICTTDCPISDTKPTTIQTAFSYQYWSWTLSSGGYNETVAMDRYPSGGIRVGETLIYAPNNISDSRRYTYTPGLEVTTRCNGGVFKSETEDTYDDLGNRTDGDQGTPPSDQGEPCPFQIQPAATPALKAYDDLTPPPIP